jgi:hypothetical protein
MSPQIFLHAFYVYFLKCDDVEMKNAFVLIHEEQQKFAILFCILKIIHYNNKGKSSLLCLEWFVEQEVHEGQKLLILIRILLIA